MLCESLVLSHFTYCDFLYGPCLLQHDAYRIQKIQNACCRLIFSIGKYEHISERINETNWLTMKNRRLHHLGNFVHALLQTNNFSHVLKNKFSRRRSRHDRNIRYKNKLSLPRYRTAMFKRGFSYNAIKLYNSLPDEFKLYNINKFKYKYRSLLLSQQVDD